MSKKEDQYTALRVVATIFIIICGLYLTAAGARAMKGIVAFLFGVIMFGITAQVVVFAWCAYNPGIKCDDVTPDASTFLLFALLSD